MSIRSCALGLAALVALPAAAEDLTIAYKVMAGDKPGTATTWVSSTQFKMADGDNATTFDLKSGRLTFVDNKKKQYWETTTQEMQAALAKMSAQMNEQMQAMPAPLREKMMGAMGGVAESVKVTKGGAAKTVAGYSCQPYVFSMGADPERSPMTMETCNTKDLSWPVQAWDARAAMSGGGMAGNPMGQRFQKMFDEMKKAEGLAVSEVTTMKLMGKTMVTSREVTEVKKGPIPDSVFAIPDGYKKVDSPYAKMAK
jgi:uncharacterized protein DUF4412